MKRGFALRVVALLLSVLVISIPVAFSQQLSVSIKGSDGIEGFARSTDTLSINATAFLPENQTAILRMFFEEQQEIIPCTKTNEPGNVWSCATTMFIGPGALSDSLTFVLYNPKFPTDIEKAYAVVEKAFVVDRAAPAVVSLEVAPNVTKDSLQVKYAVEDYAEPGNTSVCVGIKEIRFYEGNTIVRTEQGAREKCKASGTFTYTTEISPITGKHTLSADVIDFFGQASQKSSPKTFTVDNVAPFVIPSSLKIVDSQGNVRKHVRTPTTSADQWVGTVFVTIEGTDIEPKSVLADLSKLTGDGLKGGRVEEGNETTTTFAFPFTFTMFEQPCTITFSGKDKIGNAFEQSVGCGLVLDEKPPIFKEIYSSTLGKPEFRLSDEKGRPFVGFNTSLHVFFEELDNTGGEGSGMTNGMAYLDLSQIGLQGSVRATNCTKSGQKIWDCRWDFGEQLPVRSGIFNITLLKSTSDYLGNGLAVELTREVNSNVEFPTIVSEKVRHIPSQAGYPGPVKGDTLFFEFNISSPPESPPIGIANLSELTMSPETETFLCSYNEGAKLWQCSVSANIKRSGPFNATLTFDFFNPNRLSYTKSISVFGISNETNPNHWESSVTCEPIIDRQTAPLIPGGPKVYCTVKLKSLSPQASTASIEFGRFNDCSASNGLVTAAKLLNNQPGSTTPIFALTLAPSEYRTNELVFTCPLKILSKINQEFTENPEIENVSMRIRFFNLPLGELSKSYDERIASAKKSACGGIQKVVATLTKLVNTFNKICRLKQAFTSVVVGMAAVYVLVKGTGEALMKNPFTAPAGFKIFGIGVNLCGGTLATEGTFNSIFNFLDTACAVVNCQHTGKTGLASSFGFAAAISKSWGELCQHARVWEYRAFNIQGVDEKELVRIGFDLKPPIARDVKDSLVLSTACLCLPGIIYNINKYNQIQCDYVNCLKDAKKQGLPISYCANVKSEASCAFVFGELFQLLPFTALFNRIVGILIDILSNPFTALQVIAAYYCGPKICPAMGEPAPSTPCRTIYLVQKVTDAINSLVNIKNAFNFEIGTKSCDEACKEE